MNTDTYKRKPNFNNYNAITGKSFCVFCLKGLPKTKQDAKYSTASKKWKRQFHQGGGCAESRDLKLMFYPKEYYECITINKELITKAINNNKTPAQQKRLDDKNKTTN